MLEQVVSVADYQLSLYSIPTLITTAAILLLGLLVLVRERVSLVSLSFALVTFVVSIWLFGFSLMYSAPNPMSALWWNKVAYLGVPFIAPATYQFTVVVLKLYQRFKKVVALSWLLGGVFSALSVWSDLLIDRVQSFWWGYYTHFGPVGAVFILYFVSLLVASMGHYWVEYRKSESLKHKLRIKWLMIAFAIGYIGAFDFVGAYGIPLYAFGYLAILGFLCVAVYAIGKYHLLDITPAFAANQIINTITDALLVLDHEGIIRVLNRAASNLLGYPANALTGKPITTVFDGPQLDEVKSRLASEGSLQDFELSYTGGDGVERFLSLSASTMQAKDDQPVAFVCIVRDVSEKKRSEAAMRESEERYRAVVEQTSEGIFLADLETRRILEANASFLEMLGYSAEEVTGLTMYDFIAHERASIDVNMERLRELKRLAIGERTYRRKDGSLVDVEVSTNLIYHAGRHVVCVSTHDMTERKRHEERIKRQLERVAALRNIDTAITASLDLRITLSIILDQVTAQLKVDAADVLLLNGRTQMLEYGAGRGFRTGGISQSQLRLGEGYAGKAALQRHIFRLDELSETGDLLRAPLIVGEDFVTYFAVPLLAKGQIKGVLEIFHRSKLTPDGEWLDFLETLAGQAAIAIDNATLFDELQQSNLELALAYDITREGCSRALDLRDKETEGHTQRVTEMTARLARYMGVSDSEMAHVRRGALLHDIGKLGIPDSVLLKPGPLTDEEWEVMRLHPVYAYQWLSSIEYLRPALDIPYCHHEKWDGSGYPRGLKGEQIPRAARIFAIVDVWDALRSDRPYRPAWSEEKVRDHLRALSGTHFDPEVVSAFLSLEALPMELALTVPHELSMRSTTPSRQSAQFSRSRLG
ncbi:MAG TPA: PAS domain S-box protein [Chloroflexia bacterium]|nr:PAS domain S-box protein [Chloroflexia bacterium]